MASKQTTAAMFERMFHEANCPEARKQVAGMARVAAVKVTNAKGEPVVMNVQEFFPLEPIATNPRLENFTDVVVNCGRLEIERR